jgi:hypothetical protein
MRCAIRAFPKPGRLPRHFKRCLGNQATAVARRRRSKRCHVRLRVRKQILIRPFPKPSLTGRTRLVPMPSPKMPLEYPETLSLLPSPDTYWHKGYGTMPGQDLVHPLVWLHRSSTGRGRLTKMATYCEASALGEGFGQRHRTPMSGAGAMKRPSQTSKGKLHLAAARCGSSSFQSTKHSPVSFEIFVAYNGTRRVELASASPDKWVVNGYPLPHETTHLRASFE